MWRPLVLTRHALQTIASELGRSIIMIVLLACAIGGIIFTDLDLAHRLRVEEEQRIADGLNVVIASSAGAIDSAVCERLSAQPGFRQAGSLREGSLKVLTGDRATLAPTGSVTAGLLQLWGYSTLATLNSSGVLVGEAFGRDQELPPGAYVAFVDEAPHEVLGTIQESGRTGRNAGWVLSVETPSGMADQCWVETQPGLRTTGEDVLLALFSGDQAVEVTTLTDIDDHSADLAAEYDSRIAVGLRWPLILALSLFAGLSIYSRRSEYGLYRALNMHSTHIAFITQVEWITYTLLGTLLGLAAAFGGVYFRWTQHGDVPFLWGFDTALTDAAPAIAAAVIFAPVVAAIWRSDLASALKDR